MQAQYLITIQAYVADLFLILTAGGRNLDTSYSVQVVKY